MDNLIPKFSKGDIITRTLPDEHDFGQKLEILSVNLALGRYVLVDGHELSFDDQDEYHKVHKNVLKILPDVYNSKEWSERYAAIPVNERDNNSWWYLHWKLESDMGFDKGTTTNCMSAGYSRETINWEEIHGRKVTKVCKDSYMIHRMCVEGEVPVEIKGSDKPCVGFFWIDRSEEIEHEGIEFPYWHQRGLVCYADDTEGCDDARKKMYEKPVVF